MYRYFHSKLSRKSIAQKVEHANQRRKEAAGKREIIKAHLARHGADGESFAREVAKPLTYTMDYLFRGHPDGLRGDWTKDVGLVPSVGGIFLAATLFPVTILVGASDQNGSDASSRYFSFLSSLAGEVTGFVSLTPKAIASAGGAAVGVAIGLATVPRALIKAKAEDKQFVEAWKAWSTGTKALGDKSFSSHDLSLLLKVPKSSLPLLREQSELLPPKSLCVPVLLALVGNLDLGPLMTKQLQLHPMPKSAGPRMVREAILTMAADIRKKFWFSSETSPAHALQPLGIAREKAREMVCPITLESGDELKQPVALVSGNHVHIFEYEDLMTLWKTQEPKNPMTNQPAAIDDLRGVFIED